MESESLTLESGWLPAAELRRLISESQPESGSLSVASDDATHRGLDPVIASAVVSGIVSVLVPFVAKLAERVFAAEPTASLTITDTSGDSEIVLHTTLSPVVRDELVSKALSSGSLRVRISRDSPE